MSSDVEIERAICAARLEHGWTISPTTSITKEPKRPKVLVHDSDIDKFGTKHEYETELGQYIDRRPKKIHEMTFEQEINNPKKDLLRKDLGSKRIKRSQKHPVDRDFILSGRSCLSTSSNIARALKMTTLERNPQQDEAFQNQPDLK